MEQHLRDIAKKIKSEEPGRMSFEKGTGVFSGNEDMMKNENMGLMDNTEDYNE